MALKLVWYRMLWTHIAERESMSTSSAILMIPFMRSIWMLQKEWTVQPKWCPWWTRGSCTNLKHQPNMVRPTKRCKKNTYTFFCGPSSRVLGLDCFCEVGPSLEVDLDWFQELLITETPEATQCWQVHCRTKPIYTFCMMYDIVLRKFCCNEASVDEPICKT